MKIIIDIISLWSFTVIYVVVCYVCGLFCSYPTLSCWFNLSDMKAVKELYERRQEEMIGDEDVFYIFPLFLG